MAGTDVKICNYCSKRYTRKKRTASQWEASKWCSPKCLGLWRTGENHFSWKIIPSYGAIHKYAANHFENKNECEDCGISGLLHWANISGEYRRDRSDWKILCPKCHAAFDKKNGKKFGVKKSHCKRGHEFTGANLYVNPNSNERSCRACWKIRYYEKKQREAEYAGSHKGIH